MSTFHAGVCWSPVILERGVYTASWLIVCVCARVCVCVCVCARVCVCVVDRGTPPAMPVPLPTADLGQRLCRAPLCSPSPRLTGAPEMALTPVGPVPTTHRGSCAEPVSDITPRLTNSSHGLGRPRTPVPMLAQVPCRWSPRCGGSGCRMPGPVKLGRPCHRSPWSPLNPSVLGRESPFTPLQFSQRIQKSLHLLAGQEPSLCSHWRTCF